MWNPFKRTPKTYEIVAEIPITFSAELAKLSKWRTGMWVMAGDQIGILNKLDLPLVEVHFVDRETGETTLIQNVVLNALRQAKYAEIPECRRTNFPLELARSLGYDN